MDTRSVKRNYYIQQWKSIIQDRNNSGMSVNAYCKQNGISRNSYFYWLRIIREETLAQQAPSGFVELNPQTDSESGLSVVTAFPTETPETSQLTLSINGVTLLVTENTSSALLARTIGVLKNA
jgi:transposase-like protein